LGDVALRPIPDIDGVPELFDVFGVDELDVLPAKFGVPDVVLERMPVGVLRGLGNRTPPSISDSR
jgi:hypothetical protein